MGLSHAFDQPLFTKDPRITEQFYNFKHGTTTDTSSDDAYLASLGDNLQNQWWRLNNLYSIRDVNGHLIPFKPNLAQTMLYKNMHTKNVVLKARQQGVTTWVSIFALDSSLYNKNFACAMIAHTGQAATELLSHKIKDVYDALHPALKRKVRMIKNNMSMCEFSNGSSITVGLSHRSGTFQFLHISELGKLAAAYPQKAEEVRSGALNTIHGGQSVFIESTAEGNRGFFYEVCDTAMRLANSNQELTDVDYKFHFFPWYIDDKYKLSKKDTSRTVITKEMADYFQTVPAELSDEQKAWYVKKHQEMGPLMKREFPSTPEEAFEQSLQGRIFRTEMEYIRKNNHIRKIAYDPRYPVYTFWDLGKGANRMVIWYMQHIDGEYRFINYHQSSGHGWNYYVTELQSHPYAYGCHFWPHDGGTRVMMGELVTAEQFASSLGINPIQIVIRAKSENYDIINKCRPMLMMSHFDEIHCAIGVNGLDSSCWGWDTTKGDFTDAPKEDEFIDAIDAFRTFAAGYDDRGDERMNKFNNLRLRNGAKANTSYDIFA